MATLDINYCMINEVDSSACIPNSSDQSFIESNDSVVNYHSVTDMNDGASDGNRLTLIGSGYRYNWMCHRGKRDGEYRDDVDC